jgi:glutamyl-tRNA reductase
MNSNQSEMFCVIGISYKTAHVDRREKFSFDPQSLPHALQQIRSIDCVSECVVLSTCNRTEVYAVIDDTSRNFRHEIDRFILETSGLDASFLNDFYFLDGQQAVKHLFQVACGLDSMVIGETQIFGQIKNAYTAACDAMCVGVFINRLFHMAFQVGKQVRTETVIGEGTVSICSAAVLLMARSRGTLQDSKVLLLGTGKIGRLCAKHLSGNGIGELIIANRTLEHAQALVTDIPSRIVPIEDVQSVLHEVDFVITSISSPQPFITSDMLKQRVDGHGSNPLAIIDMGVPRNVATDVAEIENVQLFNMDDIEMVSNDTHSERMKEKQTALTLIEEQIIEFDSWMKMREVIPTINSLRAKYENIRLAELGRISTKISPETYETVDLVTRRIIRKILHTPTINMRASEGGEARKRLIESVYELFISEPTG